MTRPIRIRLSDAQVSAIECRDIIEDPTSPGAQAFTGSHLICDPADGDDLAEWLNDASNAEDEHSDILRSEGERELATLTGRSARSLAALYGKVLRAIHQGSARDFSTTTN